MVTIKLEENGKITRKFTAAEAISEGDVVYIASDGRVAKATTTEARQAIGVAAETALSAGDEIEVIIFGIAQVTADDAINPGDTVVPASTAGRVIAENSVSHSHVAFKNSGTDAAPTTSATQKVVGGDGTEATNVYVTVESGAASEEIKTDSQAVEHGRAIGIALTAASAAGDTIEILVCKMG